MKKICRVTGLRSGPALLRLCMLLILLLAGIAGPALAQVIPQDKIDYAILALVTTMKSSAIARYDLDGPALRAATGTSLRLDSRGRIQVYIAVDAMLPATTARLTELEAEIQLANEALKVFQAWIWPDRAAEIAALPEVLKVATPTYARAKIGSRLTQGDALLSADDVRALGVTGRGVRVGVISDGANSAALAQASGDLPPVITMFGSCTPEAPDYPNCFRGFDCDEGTAMLEIIHDIAPDAELAMAAVGTSLEFIERVDDLVQQFHADIIVDDLGFFAEPWFADGPIAQAVAAVADDVVFVSAAGNEGQRHYEADMRPTTTVIAGDSFTTHNFGLASGSTSDHSLNITIEPEGYMLAILQWNDAFGSSGNDYDLYLLNEQEDDILCEACLSAAPQDATDSIADDPLEGLCYYNPGPEAVTGKLVIDRYDGVNRRLEMFILARSGRMDEYKVPAGSIIGHSAVPGVLAVGAIDAADAGSDTIEDYSSHGPSRIDFPTLVTRNKPDLAAIDGVTVTGAGGFPSPFFGTSAAAPHVAGVAALLKEASPAQSPAMLRAALTGGAIDLGTSGFDAIYGFGRVDAQGAWNVTDFDIDNDEMLDRLELAVGLDPYLGSDGALDPDGDGLVNRQELLLGTNHLAADTDGDGLTDGYEVAAGLDPLTSNSTAILSILNLLLED